VERRVVMLLHVCSLQLAVRVATTMTQAAYTPVTRG
jgi:hypothetical protein